MNSKRHSFNCINRTKMVHPSKLPLSKSLTLALTKQSSEKSLSEKAIIIDATNATSDTIYESCPDSLKSIQEPKAQSLSESVYHDAKQQSILDIVKNKKQNNRRLISCKYNARITNTISNLTKEIVNYKKTDSGNVFEMLYHECLKINELLANVISKQHSKETESNLVDYDKDDTLGDISSSFSESNSHSYKNRTLKKKINRFKNRKYFNRGLRYISRDNTLYSFIICLNKLMSKMNKLKNPTSNLTNQTNNNNDDHDTNNTSRMSNQQYFRNAQLLLSNNSSQIQNIFGDNQLANKRNSFKTRPYLNGQLYDKPTSQLEEQFKQNNKLPFPTPNPVVHEPIIDIIDDESKPEIENSCLKRYRERQAKKKFDQQLRDYDKVRQNVEISRSNSKCLNTKNLNEIKEPNSCRSNISETETLINQTTSRSCKKVSFDQTADKIKTFQPMYPDNDEKTDYVITKLNSLDDNIQSFMVTTNNLTRRMNNLEVNFQEFSQLFVQLLEKSVKSNALMNNNCNNHYNQ